MNRAERIELENLLEQNYDRLLDDRCRQLTLAYVRETPSVRSEDIIFIKRDSSPILRKL